MAEEKKFAGGFTNMLNKVLGLDVDTASKVVLQNIIRFYNKNKGYSYPSISLLMNECQLSRQGVINAIKKLERLGYIRKETVKGKGNRYFLSEFCLYEEKHGLFTSQRNRPVNEVDQSINFTSQQNRLHQSTRLTTLVNEVDPTNTNINTNTITNNTCGSKEPFKASKSSKRETKKFDDTSVEYKLSKTLLESIRKINPKFKEPNLQNWSKDFDKIIRLDKREIKDITDLIDWIYQNDFWKSNILSPGKLRKQFDNLYTKMINDKEYKKTTTNHLETPSEKDLKTAADFWGEV